MDVSRRFDCSDRDQRSIGLTDAITAVRCGELVVMPTDTVYGIGADAFTPSAVEALLGAKGRGRDMPVAVLVGSVRAASALVSDWAAYGRDLVEAYWPGPLTVILPESSTLAWDLGDTRGTVALRMPRHQLALDLLNDAGPMAVSSANRSGEPPATTVDDAERQLGESVSVYLDDGVCDEQEPSTIVDLTGIVPRLVRQGALPKGKIREIVGSLRDETEKAAPAGAEADANGAGSDDG